MTVEYKPKLDADAMSRIRNKVYALCEELEEFAQDIAMDVTPETTLNGEDSGEELLITEEIIISLLISQLKWEI